MNKLFNKLSFPVKLMLLGLIPLAFLIYFAIEIISEKQQRIKIVSDVISNVNNSILVGRLSSELHLERRHHFRFLFNKGSEAEITAQHLRTDQALAELEATGDTSYNNFKKFSLLNQLGSMREQILKRELTPEECLNYYSNVLQRTHSYYNSSFQNIPYLKNVSKDLVAQRLIFDVLNYFGLVRAEIYIGVVRKGLSQHELFTLQRNLALTFSYADEFNAKADTSVITSFTQVNKSEESKYANEILLQLLSSNKLPENINPEEWWVTTGTLIDNIIKIQKRLINITKENSQTLLTAETEALYIAVALLIGILVLVIFIILYTIRNITGILSNLQSAAENMALGESANHLNLNTNDALGSLERSIKSIDVNNNILAKAADSIGKGNFDIAITPRSDKDVLGNAIVHMKEELQRLSIESSEKIWVQTGLTNIHDAVKGERKVDDLAANILTSVTNYLNAQIGLIYVSKEDKLKYMSGYALTAGYNPPQTITFGETLIGEAAKQKKIMYLQEIPDDYLKISSAGGSTMPRHILVIPLVYNEIVEGVIELGSVLPFSKVALQLVEQAVPNIAIAMHSSKSREKLQELLEETQAQSEELQAQHSELESLNAELEAQAQRLQSSEEELKVQQEELLQSNQELEERSAALEEKNQLIVERNLDIQKKAEELELSTKYKSEFLANMSHELRTPLNSILLLSRLMYENPEENLTPDQIEYAQVIQSSGNGLLALIDEILDLSKIEAGKMDLEYSDVPVNDIVSNMRSLFTPIAREKNLEFNINVEPNTPHRISTDKMRIEQIIKNLLSNALKFTTKGSVSLNISLASEPMMIKISVADTGIGIPREKQYHVFEAFQQADGSTKRKFGGTGLGLSISRQLARLLGGEILLNSEEGRGSEFSLIVPVSKSIKKDSEEKQSIPNSGDRPITPAPQAELVRQINYVVDTIPQPIPDDRASVQEGDKIILIVEDDTNFAKALLSYTRKAGYKGLVAVRGDEGIDMATEFKPQAILLDIQLPVKDGWEVMEELKANPQTRHIPVHIMSSMQVKRESLLKGAVDFINKPIAMEQMQQMFAKLEDALSKHPKKVLIIEENPQHAKALAYFLETFNVNAEIKDSVSESVDSLLKADAECVILDMGIPDNSSYETLENIKKNPGLENLPIIIFTGKNLSKHEESKLKYYADSIVMKTAHSYQRILDEVSLFLHLVEEKKVTEKAHSGRRKNLPELTEVLKGKTVLIADDDVRNIFSLTKALEQIKMKVLSATDGGDAIKVLEENPQTDIVLMDMMMPEMDGYESIQKIRKNIKYRNLPILAVTAKAMVGDREKCIKAGASDYISKPVDIDQLISLLRVWLYSGGA